MTSAAPRLCAAVVVGVFLAACAGDLGGDRGLPACGLQPSTPIGFEFSKREEVVEEDHVGFREEYVGLQGERMVFDYGISNDAAAGLPKGERLPLATLGAGRLFGGGREWAFVWSAEFPCDRMSVIGTGLDKKGFLAALGSSGVIAFEEGEAEGGAGLGGGEEPEGEIEGEIEGVLPPGGPTIEWVAIFATARDRSDLERIERELMETAPGNVAVSPASCWKGLPQQLGVQRDAFVAGLVAVTGNELDFYVERVGAGTIFYGQLRARCD